MFLSLFFQGPERKLDVSVSCSEGKQRHRKMIGCSAALLWLLLKNFQAQQATGVPQRLSIRMSESSFVCCSRLLGSRLAGRVVAISRFLLATFYRNISKL